MFAMRAHRFMHDNGVKQDALKAIALTSYYHAQRNPRAVMYGRPLSPEDYDNSRWIVEPFHLFDCCQENDGAAAMIVTTAERARDLKQKPAYVLSAAQGSDYRQGAVAHNDPDYGDVELQDRRQAPLRHGRDCAEGRRRCPGVRELHRRRAHEHRRARLLRAGGGERRSCTLDNLKFDGGKLPLNTSGGNLAECYMHGLELNIEAVRQIRGESTAQVAERRDLARCLWADGPAGQRLHPERFLRRE